MRHWVILPIIYTDKGKVFDVDLSLNILKSFLFAEIGIYELLENGSAMVHYGNNVLLLNPEGVKKAALRVSSDWFSVGEKSMLSVLIGNGLWKCWVSRIYRCVLIVVLSYSVLIAYICKRFGTSKNEYTNKIYYS